MNKQIEHRIERVINNLLPSSGVNGKSHAPQSLYERLAYYHTPGVSIAVINDFQIEWTRGFGMCDLRSKRKVTPDTLFQAGSISKPVFALGIMRLVQDGLLSLDEDVNRYLSTWQVPINDSWQPNITLRQLLSHTAGLTVHGFPGYQMTEMIPSIPQILNGETPANTGKVEVNILPGLQFRYSGGGTTIAQQLIMDVIKKPFPQILSELVFAPLGMTDSTYEQPLPKHLAMRAATAYPWKGIPLKGKFHTYPEMAAAGLWTTAKDLATMGVELLKILRGNNCHGVSAKETIETMLSPQLKTKITNQTVGEGEFAGLGLFVNGKDDNFYFRHAGWNEGYVAQMRFYKNTGQGAVIMLNSNEGEPLIDEILLAIAKEYDCPDATLRERAVVHLKNTHDYTGLYSSTTGMQFAIDVMGDNLTLQYGQQLPLPIIPTSEVDFFTRAISSTFRFERDNNAQIVSMTISQDGNQIIADRHGTN